MKYPATLAGVTACWDCDYPHHKSHRGVAGNCARCDSALAVGGRQNTDLPLALAWSAVLLFLIVCAEPLIVVSEQGASREDFLSSGALILFSQGYGPLALVVLFFSMLAPGLRLGLLGYVLTTFRWPDYNRFAPQALKLAGSLRPWAMLDVFLVGSIVAYTRLRDILQVRIGVGGYYLVALVIVLLALDSRLSDQPLWSQFGPRQPSPEPDSTRTLANRATCLVCGDVVHGSDDDPDSPIRCPRCNTRILRRRANSVGRCWALISAAVILYIPANLLPVMTIVRLGRVESDTILSGVRALVAADMWPLAIIVFMASIAVPVLKLAGLTVMLLTIHFKWRARLVGRTRLYRLIETIGRWSNIDVFMVSILAALVQFGTLTTVRAGPGIIPFASVVMITMFASHVFDPRLMWDNAETPIGGAV